jgi:hypothetical protein
MKNQTFIQIVFSEEIVVSSLRGYYSVGEGNTCGVVINVREMFVLF